MCQGFARVGSDYYVAWSDVANKLIGLAKVTHPIAEIASQTWTIVNEIYAIENANFKVGSVFLNNHFLVPVQVLHNSNFEAGNTSVGFILSTARASQASQGFPSKTHDTSLAAFGTLALSTNSFI